MGSTVRTGHLPSPGFRTGIFHKSWPEEVPYVICLLRDERERHKIRFWSSLDYLCFYNRRIMERMDLFMRDVRDFSRKTGKMTSAFLCPPPSDPGEKFRPAMHRSVAGYRSRFSQALSPLAPPWKKTSSSLPPLLPARRPPFEWQPLQC